MDHHSNLTARLDRLPEDKRREAIRRLRDLGVDPSSLPIVVQRPDKMLPLSYSQTALWLTWRMAPHSSAYNISGILMLTGQLHLHALQSAIRQLIERHEVLRTVFPCTGALEPSQQIRTTHEEFLRVHDVSDHSPTEAEAKATQIATGQADAPFDLENDPASRFVLIKLGEQSHWLVVVVHHILADNWSESILVSDLAELYEAHVAAREPQLPPLTIQYADYAIWQRDECVPAELDRQLHYWKSKLGMDHPPIALPLDWPRSPLRDDRGSVFRFKLDRGLASSLRETAKSRDASIFMVMVSLLNLVLYRFSGHNDIRVGTPIANRERTQTQGMIGYFANMLVLRTDVDPRAAFVDLVDAVRIVVLEAQANKICPFDMLASRLDPHHSIEVHPLFQVKCTEISAVSGRELFRSLSVALQAVRMGKIHFDLSFDYRADGQEIDCSFTYAISLFGESTIARFARAFIELAQQVAAEPKRRIVDMALSDLVGELVESTRDYSAPCVQLLLYRTAAAHPNSIAVRDKGTEVSYGQLAVMSSLFAARLTQLGVSAEIRVAVHADRSLEFVVGLLAVWKAGGVCVPLDPRLPTERLSYQLEDCNARVLLSTTTVEWAEGIPVLDLTAENRAKEESGDLGELPPGLHPSQSAYVIYTSGSTGQPKGVVVSHGALSNYVQGILEGLALPDEVRNFAMVSTVAADLGHTVLFGALCSGRTLHLISPECAFDPDRFAAYMRGHQVDVLKIVPSHLQAMLSAASPADVLPRHTLILGGEATSWALLDRIGELKPECRVINHYGPTETTVGVFTQEATTALRSTGTLPIGSPLPNTQGYVLDAYLNCVPQGVVGELYLGGAGLARGYDRQGALTAERFVSSPFKEGERLYRTGDRVRVLKNGRLEFLGRTDDQVKVRGYRVELREIANTLKAQEGVREAEVIARTTDDGRTQLYGYVVAQADVVLEQQTLQQQLSAILPEYMVPSAIVVLEKMPLTANGKVDRKALPEPARIIDRYEAPQGDIEETLAAIWAEVLGVERVGRHDNFFELGGDSILTLKTLARARQHSITLVPKQLLQHQTLSALASEIADRRDAESRTVHQRMAEMSRLIEDLEVARDAK